MAEPIFETERLIAHRINESHEALFRTIYSDGELMHFIADPLGDNRLDKAWRLTLKQNQSIPHQRLTLVISEKSTSVEIGLGGLDWRTNAPQLANMGCMLVKKSHNKGYAAEFLKRLIEYSYTDLQINKLYSTSDVKNIQSYQLMKKLGYSPQDANSDRFYYWPVFTKV
ncbi:MAG: hypothetical protein COW84_10365 [Gammaproteobacteria bacterium CG22_combo_CG10-13_8_21_14_all_40_8]|nr:MAG: hypothetical protein COW84_10365 [Gammaproteobacteria bacterium CG22_combo_CG10-13_8_21_14_all_40_8]